MIRKSFTVMGNDQRAVEQLADRYRAGSEVLLDLVELLVVGNSAVIPETPFSPYAEDHGRIRALRQHTMEIRWLLRLHRESAVVDREIGLQEGITFLK